MHQVINRIPSWHSTPALSILLQKKWGCKINSLHELDTVFPPGNFLK